MKWSVASIFLIIITAVISLSGGYYIGITVLGHADRVPSFSIYIAQCIFSILIFILSWELYLNIHWRFNKKGRQFDLSRSQILKGAIDAMSKIASGDFNVFVKTDEHDPFNEVADNINRMAKELGSLEKMRQDFVSDVSHEIQSPLTSISGFAALLKKENLSESQITHYASIIEAESKRLSKLSGSLLRLSNLESEDCSLNVKPFQIDKQIESVLLMLEPQWSAKHITLDVFLPKIMICGDEDLLNEVLINLIHNAIKFTPENGYIGIHLSGNENEIEIKISDTGIGIAQQDQLRIFERFYKADKSRDRSLGGNGLGLSIVKKIIDMHGGKIKVESEIGRGTEFTVSLPK